MRKSRALLTAPVVALLVAGLPAFGSVSMGAPKLTNAQAACAPEKGVVNITYAAWNTDFAGAVKAFNATHPSIHVTFELTTFRDYQNLFNDLAAHKVPDVAMLEYEVMPAFRLQNGLQDISACAAVKDIKSQFPSWEVNQVSIGTNAIYGVPQDVEPLALVYRKDIFTKYNVPVPTTWAQYMSDALKLKAADPSVKWTDLTSQDQATFIALDWQAGARPFVYSGNSFIFDMDSPQMTKVSNYWTTLVKDGVINSTALPFTPAIYSAWDAGTIATMVVPAYMPDVMKDNAPKSSGDWAVAPVPQWNAGTVVDGNSGGSAIAVMAGTKHPYAAAVFAEWLGGSTAGIEASFGGIDPELAGANSYNSTPIVSTPYPYFGGQRVLEVFRKASAGVNENFQWAPNMLAVTNELGDNLAGAMNGSTTIAAAFEKTQAEAAANLKSLGVTVITK